MKRSSPHGTLAGPSKPRAAAEEAARPNQEMAISEQVKTLSRNAVEVISEPELIRKLDEKRPLRIKLGMDPTAPDLHLGHTIALQKLGDFQRHGHTVIFLVGDFTAMIGDPTGRSEVRPALSAEQIRKNAETYRKQVFKVLDPRTTEIRFNSEWMNEMGTSDLIKTAAHISVARLLERDDFEQRLDERRPLFLHELLYPVIQGYDSVALRADVEIGGTDQKFNMLIGRELQRAFGQPAQVVMTLPILEGLDGTRKMSKSLRNYVGLVEPAEEMFGKLMSISDQLMVRYYELLTDASAEEIAGIKSGALHPMEAKKQLASAIVSRYHDPRAAEKAREYFEIKFQRRQVPQQVPVFRLAEALWICELMKQLGFAASTTEARRLIAQRAVKVDGEVVTDMNYRFTPGQQSLLEVGKRRIARIQK
jgi:tyrosyl-tRNA synthetase